MFMFYGIGFGLHICAIYSAKQNGPWLFFVNGNFSFLFNVPIAMCAISLAFQHFWYKNESHRKGFGNVWINAILVAVNLTAVVVGFYFFAWKSIPVTFVGQSLFVSVAFGVLGFVSLFFLFNCSIFPPFLNERIESE
ncbi:hypothetical protein EIN_057760 [Entamoeba invadens IP1]|uniref:hypothetical protein n=1 Tax=Entamoeba invadens IP1 TaxID=370355 RepID=UPI0002C3E331|nr:hypothetical protein EIN_057760 [Entamoeba invadens IP1]ELP93371.1 hypothetical protein EIN_057760 [Entamoeba invadens IP1]|eukprot:XP_004260142.1 hypothetical protein EIN_057760 [Entamoeba invadens IP1]